MALRRILLLILLTIAFVENQSQELPNINDIMSIVTNKPFETLGLVSIPVTPEDVDFYLNTRSDSYNDYRFDESKLYSLDPSKPLKYIVHGWMENGRKARYKDMAEEFLRNGDYNVMRVDWYKPALYSYPASAQSTRGVGAIIGEQIARIHQQLNLPLENVHIIGHSLGSHVAGFAGKKVKELLGAKIGRITGLDPAGPLFEGQSIDRNSRLNSDDARVVDVLHTDGGVFGFLKPLGTVDFFANGGVPLQPGCISAITTLFKSSTRSDYFFCSHARSVSYYIESINSNGFVATGCESWNSYQRGYCDSRRKVVFGQNLPRQIRGDYHFRTNSRSPFALM